jgi:hypothetical protein
LHWVSSEVRLHSPRKVSGELGGGGGALYVQLDEGPSHLPRDEGSSSAFFDGEHVSRATDDEYLSRFPDLAKQRKAIINANVKMTILAVTGVSLEDVATRGGAAYAVGQGNKIQGRIDALDAHARKRGGMYKSERSARRMMQSTQTSARHWATGFRYLGVLGFIGGMGSTAISEYEGIVTEELERAD